MKTALVLISMLIGTSLASATTPTKNNKPALAILHAKVVPLPTSIGIDLPKKLHCGKTIIDIDELLAKQARADVANLIAISKQGADLIINLSEDDDYDLFRIRNADLWNLLSKRANSVPADKVTGFSHSADFLAIKKVKCSI